MKNFKLNTLAKVAFSMALIFSIGILSAIAKKPAKPTQSIVEIAVSNDNFTVLVEALQKAELVDALNGNGPYTVFAPTDKAFEALFNELGVNGVDDLTKDQLTPILLYHVVNGKVMAKDVTSGMVSTLNKDASIDIEASKSGVKLNNNSKVVLTDVDATNGVIHVIDTVLVPETKKATKSDKGSC